MKICCVIAVAFALNQRLRAQGVETTTAPAPSTVATAIDTATEGPIVETSPYDGSPITATTGINSGFNLLRKLRTSISLVTGYDDNINTSGTAPEGSLYASGRAALSYSFGSPRTRVSLAGGGGITYYFDRAEGSKYDGNGYFAASFLHKFTKRLTLTMDALVSYQPQPDLSTDLGSNQALGSFVRLTDTNSLTFLLGPRFSTITNYTLGALRYGSEAGSLQNRFEQTFGQQARFLLFPSTTVDGEYRFGVINYENAPMDSTSNFLLAGFEHKFSPHLNTSFRGGIEIRSSEDDGTTFAPHFESTINYAFGRRISVTWTNGYSIEESDDPGGSSGSTFRTGLFSQIRLTRRLSAALDLNYTLGGSNNTFDVGPSMSIMIKRYLVANAGVHFTNVDSETPFISYSRSTYFVGLSFSF